jgi:hypothetical protein
MAKRIFSLDALKQQFDSEKNTNNNNNQGNYYPFWNMAIGEQAIVRFLPDKDIEKNWFLLEKSHHEWEVNGEKKRLNCLKNYNEPCPICAASQQFYKNKDEETGRQLYRKRQYLGQVLVMNDPLPVDKETGKNYEGEVKIVSLGPKIYASIKDAIETGELDAAPHSYDEGTNFILKKTQDGKYADYSRSKFDRRQSELDPDLVDDIETKLVDLVSLLPANPGAEVLSEALNKFLNGTTDEAPGYAAPVAKPKAPKVEDDEDEYVPSPAAKAAPAAAPEVSVEDDEAEAVLAQLRARRNKIQ